MKLIRKGTFETNSSSCHSLTVGSGDVYEGITPNGNNEVVVHQGDYGWSIESYDDVYSRLSYVATYVKNYGGDSAEEMLKEVVCEHTGASDLVIKGDGYIDHQSSDDVGEVFANKQILKDFIFKADSSFQTDNDNY